MICFTIFTLFPPTRTAANPIDAPSGGSHAVDAPCIELSKGVRLEKRQHFLCVRLQRAMFEPLGRVVGDQVGLIVDVEGDLLQRGGYPVGPYHEAVALILVIAVAVLVGVVTHAVNRTVLENGELHPPTTDEAVGVFHPSDHLGPRYRRQIRAGDQLEAQHRDRDRRRFSASASPFRRATVRSTPGRTNSGPGVVQSTKPDGLSIEQLRK
jgi:hypothetical protein